jgi:ribonuclease Z
LSFFVTILGSSGAVPAYGRYPSAQLINLHNEYMLVDCGEGTQMQLARYDLPLMRINHIFISHLHGDHYLGLPGLLHTMHLHHREHELHLYSPQGLGDILTVQFFYSRTALNFPVIMHTLQTEERTIILDHKHFTVETIPLRHKIPCCGFLFREKDKPRRINTEKIPPGLPYHKLVALKNGEDILDEAGQIWLKNEDYTLPPRKSCMYAYCSDTAYHEALVEQLKGVDVLYHEATFTQEDEGKANETMHSTAMQAAEIARKAGARLLLIGHFSARYRKLQVLLEEAQKIFANTRIAEEGSTHSVAEL